MGRRVYGVKVVSFPGLTGESRVSVLYVARGFLYETITQLTVFYKKQWIKENELNQLKCFGEEIGKQISTLINSIKNSIN